MGVWRLLKETERPLTTAEGLSIDDTLSQSVDRLNSPPILHLYKFVPSAIVGRYQDIEAALRLQRLEELKMEYNRRSTGGGTVIMGPTVLALGFGINVDHKGLGAGIRGVFQVMSQALIRGLGHLGIQAVFRPKNDLEVLGRKIAGLSAAMDSKKGILFHTSLLVDFDLNLLSEVMNTPLIKFKDKGYSCFSQRLTTVNMERKDPVSVEEVMDAVMKGFEEVFQVRFQTSSFTEEEWNLSLKLKEERYQNPQWIFSHRHPRVRMGIGRLKTAAGLLEVYLSLAGAVIESIFITGDFFTTTEDLNKIESALKYTRCEEEQLVNVLNSIWKDDIIYNLTPELLVEAIMLAKENQVRL